jgi:hypothetical protein
MFSSFKTGVPIKILLKFWAHTLPLHGKVPRFPFQSFCSAKSISTTIACAAQNLPSLADFELVFLQRSNAVKRLAKALRALLYTTAIPGG